MPSKSSNVQSFPVSGSGSCTPTDHHKDKHHQVQNQILIRTSASSLCQTDGQTSNSGARKPMPTPVDSVRAMRTLSSRLPAAGGEAREPCERRWRGSARRRGRDEEAANAEGRREVEVRAPATDRDMALAPSVCLCVAVGSPGKETVFILFLCRRPSNLSHLSLAKMSKILVFSYFVK